MLGSDGVSATETSHVPGAPAGSGNDTERPDGPEREVWAVGHEIVRVSTGEPVQSAEATTPFDAGA